MAKSKKEAITKVESALVSTTKPSKKSKRDVEIDLDIPKDPKKQKKELIQAVEKAPPPPKKKKNKKKKKKNTNVETVEGEEEKSIAKQPKTLFAGHLPFHIEKSHLKNFFKEVGDIVDVRLGKGIAHIEFASEEAAQKALELNGKPILGRNILLDFAKAKPAPRNQVKTIFVTGFNKSASEDEMKAALRGHFSACGEIKRISLPYYQETGDSKGVAYLDFSVDGFNKALELNGSELGGRNIVVIEARPKEKNADGNSGRGNDDTSKRGPGRGSGERRTTPSKASVIDSAAQGKKIVFDE